MFRLRFRLIFAVPGVLSLVYACHASITLCARKQDLKLERDPKGRERLAYKKDGWKFCTFEGHRVHYLQAGST